MKLNFGKGTGASLIDQILVFLRWEFHFFGISSTLKWTRSSAGGWLLPALSPWLVLTTEVKYSSRKTVLKTARDCEKKWHITQLTLSSNFYWIICFEFCILEQIIATVLFICTSSTNNKRPWVPTKRGDKKVKFKDRNIICSKFFLSRNWPSNVDWKVTTAWSWLPALMKVHQTQMVFFVELVSLHFWRGCTISKSASHGSHASQHASHIVIES